MISINISDLIWTIINFLLFCFLLNHFLFKPVLRFMDDRQARVDAKLSEKREAEALAEEKRIQAQREKGYTPEEYAQMRDRIKQELLEELKHDAEEKGAIGSETE